MIAIGFANDRHAFYSFNAFAPRISFPGETKEAGIGGMLKNCETIAAVLGDRGTLRYSVSLSPDDLRWYFKVPSGFRCWRCLNMFGTRSLGTLGSLLGFMTTISVELLAG